ncbi:hypothetical protein LKK83_19850 [Phormidium sp. CCY1219]|nr:hypothetical protein [Phormidium sp. CCY1219]
MGILPVLFCFGLPSRQWGHIFVPRTGENRRGRSPPHQDPPLAIGVYSYRINPTLKKSLKKREISHFMHRAIAPTAWDPLPR